MKEFKRTSLVKPDGADSEYIYFSVNSESELQKDYAILVDRHDGSIYCDCPDARFRKRVGYVHKESSTCKHVHRLKLWIKETLEHESN